MNSYIEIPKKADPSVKNALDLVHLLRTRKLATSPANPTYFTDNTHYFVRILSRQLGITEEDFEAYYRREYAPGLGFATPNNQNIVHSNLEA